MTREDKIYDMADSIFGLSQVDFETWVNFPNNISKQIADTVYISGICVTHLHVISHIAHSYKMQKCQKLLDRIGFVAKS